MCVAPVANEQRFRNFVRDYRRRVSPLSAPAVRANPVTVSLICTEFVTGPLAFNVQAYRLTRLIAKNRQHINFTAAQARTGATTLVAIVVFPPESCSPRTLLLSQTAT